MSSSIASSKAACTFAGARLISSARMRLPKMAWAENGTPARPFTGVNLPSQVMSLGNISGVNWIRRKSDSRLAANVFMVRVLARPGRPSNKT